MNLGFIGTGKISSSVIAGICKSSINYKKIFVSSRNRTIAIKLKKKFKNIVIEKDNQIIINKCDWIFLAVTPTVGEKIIKKLNFKSNQTIISFISTITLEQLKKMIKVKSDIVRAIPLPPISLKKGPVPICPPNKKVKNFFNKIGITIEINNEKLSKNFWAISGTMAPFFELLNTLSKLLAKKGLNKIESQKYVVYLYSALADLAVKNVSEPLDNLVKESQTPGGLNWQGINELRKLGYYKKLEKVINNIYKRL